MYLMTEAATTTFDFSSIDFSSLITTYVTILGVAIPTVISLLGLKKGISWAIGFFRRG
jgi:hypothetical protein